MNQPLNKQQALEVLIKHSYFLSEEVKRQLLEKLPSLDDDAIQKIGTFLALEKKQSLQRGQQIIETLGKIEEAISQSEKDSPRE